MKKTLPIFWYHKTIGLIKLPKTIKVLPINHNRSPAGKPVTIKRKDLYLKGKKYEYE